MLGQLFALMLKEEVRIHTKLFPKIFFFTFPVMIFLFSFMLSFFVHDEAFLMWIFSIIVFFAGITSGAYGFQAREIYLRKFPHLNFLLYSYLAMPIKNETVVLALFLKEITFSFFWFLIPFVIGLSNFNPWILINSICLFLFANSLMFLFSNLYNKKKLLYLSLILVATFLLFTFQTLSQNFLITLLLFFATFLLAMKTIDLEYYSKKTFHKNIFDSSLKLFKSPLLAKDFVDLRRSYGYARVIVSFIFPIIVIYMLLAIFQKIGISIGMFINQNIFYSLMLGLVSVSAYETMVEFDRWDYYSIFPLKKSQLIKSKITSSLILSTPLVIGLVALLTTGSILLNIFVSLISMLYVISVIIFLVGLNIQYLFDTRRILIFTAFFTPYFLLVFFSVQLYVVLSIFALISLLLLKFGFRRFD